MIAQARLIASALLLASLAILLLAWFGVLPATRDGLLLVSAMGFVLLVAAGVVLISARTEMESERAQAARELSALQLLGKQAETALRESESKLNLALDREEKFSRVDFLTGALNRRAFWEIAEAETRRAQRYARPISIAYLDVDDFKAINENFGNKIGDQLLALVASILGIHSRESDVVARLGGDEFVLLLPEAGYDAADVAITKIHRLLLSTMSDKKWPVTFSIGVVTFTAVPDSVDQMVKTADELMSAVKLDGKNRVAKAVSAG